MSLLRAIVGGGPRAPRRGWAGLPALPALFCAWLGAPQAALAADPADFVGLPVAHVSLIAVVGELPAENLEPLLRVRQDEPLDLGFVRQDIALLHRAGAFDAVEAHAEPWSTDGENGVVQGVIVSYRVVSAPRLSEVSVKGMRPGEARRVASTAVALHADDVFYAEAELTAVETRVRGALASAGWSHAEVRAEEQIGEDGARRLEVQVEAGQPSTYGELVVLGDIVPQQGTRLCGPWGSAWLRPGCGLPARKVRRWLRRAGVREGGRVKPADFDEALVDLRQRLVAKGWLQARVSYRALRAEAGEFEERRTLTIEGGPRVLVEIDRRSKRERLLPEADAQNEALGFFGGERIDGSTPREAEARLVDWFDRLGFPNAEVAVERVETDWGTRLVVRADPKQRVRARRIEVNGAEALGNANVAAALRAAAPDTLGEKRMSRAGVEEALAGVSEVYRGRGYLSTKLVFLHTQPMKRRLPWLAPGRRALPVAVVVRVQEGPLTVLGSLEAEGGIGLEDQLIEERRSALVGGPYSPSGLAALEKQVSELYQAQGYLDVLVDVKVTFADDGRVARALVDLRPGQQVLLRSVVVRGNRRTRAKVVSREVKVQIGQPITPAALSETRQAIYALDLFRTVSPELVGEDAGVRDLLLSVDEKPNIQVDLGGRLSSDQGLLAQARATHRNLGGLGQKVSLLGQVGYGWFGEQWRIDTLQPVYRAAVRYTAPHVPTRSSTLFVEALLREALQEPTFRIRRSGALVGLNQQLSPRVFLILDYGLDWRVLEDVDPGALVPGDPWLSVLGVSASGLGEVVVPSDRRVQGGPSLLVVRDARNDKFNPTSGSFLSTQIEAADGLFSSIQLLRAEVRAEKVASVGPVVLDFVARGGAGWVRGGHSTLALEDRFYLGGGGSMRGFRLNGVGPANYAARPRLDLPSGIEPVVEGRAVRAEPAQWVNTGGDSLLKGTFEVRVPFSVLPNVQSDKASLVTFTEVGRVAFLDPAAVTTSSAQGRDPLARVSFGFGVRVATPIGPAALELGINPWSLSERDEATFLPHLSIGGL